jgi:hypothetical protein
VVEHYTHNPKLEGLNPGGTNRVKMVKSELKTVWYLKEQNIIIKKKCCEVLCYGQCNEQFKIVSYNCNPTS